MKITEIVKARLKGCGIGTNYLYAKDKLRCGYMFPDKSLFLCPTCKATLTGMETIIKESLEFLERVDKAKYEYWEDFDENWLGKELEKEITDRKDALKLIKEAK